MRKISFLFVMMILGVCYAQNNNNYAWPIDSPRVITGNYGELRPNHFHAGIDFSTNGKTGYPVYSIADGYVSRIKVSSVGYGKSVYITHNDGKVTLYGHLSSYNPAIAAVVKKMQYQKQSYDVDFNLKPNEIKFKRKEQIGLSGNSGASTGPHLHFEIRDEKTETPLNPLEYFVIQDTTMPTIERVAFYNLADTSSPKFLAAFKLKKNKKDSLMLEKDSVILRNGILGFAFSGFDQFAPKGNPNNIYSARLFFDDRLIYSHTLDNIHFSEQRFANEFSENVELSKKEKVKFQKCFVPTLYPPYLYEKCRNKGRILLIDTNYHKIRLAVNDENGNERIIQFTFKTRKLNYYSKPSINSDVYATCTEDLMINKNKLQIYIPANTLYYSTGLIFENTIESTGKLIILPTDANLKSTSIVGFEVPKKYMKNKNRLVLKSGEDVLPPINANDSVFFSVKNLGWFLLDLDTVAPKVKTQLPVAQLQKAKNLQSLSFNVIDNLSGINKYNLFLNDTWVLGEYDAKSNQVVYYFDENTPKGALNFRLEVDDKVKNKSVFQLALKR